MPTTLVLDDNLQPIPALRPGVVQSVAFTSAGSTAITNAVSASTKVVRVTAWDADAYVEFGPSPIAASTSMRMAAGVPEYFSVPMGASYKVAARGVTGSGTLGVVEMV